MTLFLTLLVLASCKKPTERPNSYVLMDSSKINHRDTESITNSNFIEKKASIETSNIDSFLKKPFELYAFKQKKQGSLSSGAYFEDYHFKPTVPGTGYSFFMFQPKETNYTIDGKALRHSKVGYIGSNKKRISLKEDGLTIKTFQPDNQFKDKFLNPNEILIEVVAKHNDFDLPELAFVGLDIKSVQDKLGQEKTFKNECLVYFTENRALILKVNQERVEWLRYILVHDRFEKHLENENLYTAE